MAFLLSCLSAVTFSASVSCSGACRRGYLKGQANRIDACTYSLRVHGGYIRRSLRAVRVLLVLVGVAAFALSAVSPDDDDIQQEFFQQQRFRCSRIARVGTARTNHLSSNRKLTSAVLVVPSPSIHQEHEPSTVGESNAFVTMVTSACGMRSPPLS